MENMNDEKHHKMMLKHIKAIHRKWVIDNILDHASVPRNFTPERLIARIFEKEHIEIPREEAVRYLKMYLDSRGEPSAYLG